MPWNCYKTVSFSTSSVPQICKKKVKEYWICFCQLRMCGYRGNTYDPLKLFLTAKSRDRTADITASCIEGNITWWSIAEIAAFPDELPSLLVIIAAKEEYDKELKQLRPVDLACKNSRLSSLGARSEEHVGVLAPQHASIALATLRPEDWFKTFAL